MPAVHPKWKPLTRRRRFALWVAKLALAADLGAAGLDMGVRGTIHQLENRTYARQDALHARSRENYERYMARDRELVNLSLAPDVDERILEREPALEGRLRPLMREYDRITRELEQLNKKPHNQWTKEDQQRAYRLETASQANIDSRYLIWTKSAYIKDIRKEREKNHAAYVKARDVNQQEEFNAWKKGVALRNAHMWFNRFRPQISMAGGTLSAALLLLAFTRLRPAYRMKRSEKKERKKTGAFNPSKGRVFTIDQFVHEVDQGAFRGLFQDVRNAKSAVAKNQAMNQLAEALATNPGSRLQQITSGYQYFYVDGKYLVFSNDPHRL